MRASVEDKIAVLEVARQRIETGASSYLCLALDTVAHGSFATEGRRLAAYELIEEISNAFRRDGISGDATVAMWLEHVTGREVTINLRAYRIRWIDSWIAELKAGTKT